MEEIERKFLVHRGKIGSGLPFTSIRQGYLSVDPARVVRVRIEGEQATLTIKGALSGMTRKEFEYPLPPGDAAELLKLALHPPVEKRRYRITLEGTLWEVDEFLGVNQGLWLAEVELESESQPFSRPEWLGREVTDDGRYYNAWLSEHPFTLWEEEE